MKTIFFGASGSVVKWAYKDVYDNSDVEYCEFDEKNIGKNFLSKLLFFGGKGALLPYFVKNKIYLKNLPYDFLNVQNEDCLFVFTCQYGMFFAGGFFSFVNYLKQRYKNCKCVFYFNDIVSTCEASKFLRIKNSFDLVLTFDRQEAAEYGMTYYGIVHSKANPAENEYAEDSDVFYVGSDRGRFDDIISVFRLLAEADKRCVFYILDVLDENKVKLKEFLINTELVGKAYKYKNSLLYINEYCWYGKTLKYISKTKCLVEILLPAQTAGTLRQAEAVMYDKKLITNCQEVREISYYRKENIFVFEKPEDIDVKFLDVPFVPVEYDFSPLKMIEFVKNKLYKEEIK